MCRETRQWGRRRAHLCERCSSARRCSIMKVTASSELPWQKRSPRLACAGAHSGQPNECAGRLPCPAQQVSARRKKVKIAWLVAKAVQVLLPIWSVGSWCALCRLLLPPGLSVSQVSKPDV